MAHYLGPKADIVFKKIFGEHPDLLKSFLNSVLPLEADQRIDTLDYIPNEQVPRKSLDVPDPASSTFLN